MKISVSKKMKNQNENLKKKVKNLIGPISLLLDLAASNSMIVIQQARSTFDDVLYDWNDRLLRPQSVEIIITNYYPNLPHIYLRFAKFSTSKKVSTNKPIHDLNNQTTPRFGKYQMNQNMNHKKKVLLNRLKRWFNILNLIYTKKYRLSYPQIKMFNISRYIISISY